MINKSVSFLFCALIFVVIQSTFGLKDESSEFRYAEDMKFLKTSYEEKGNMRVKSDTGIPVTMYNPNFPVTGKTPLDKAYYFIGKNLKLMKLDTLINPLSSNELDLSSHFQHLSTSQVHSLWTTVRLQQIFHGVPVHDAFFTITINDSDLVNMVFCEYKSVIDVDIGAMKSTKHKADEISRDAIEKYGNGDTNKILITTEPTLTVHVDEELGESTIAWCYKYYNKESFTEMENCINDETNAALFERDISVGLKGRKRKAESSSSFKTQNLRWSKYNPSKDTINQMNENTENTNKFKTQSIPEMTRKLKGFKNLTSIQPGDPAHETLMDIFNAAGVSPDRRLEGVCIPKLIQFLIDLVGLGISNEIDFPDRPGIPDIDDIVNVPTFLENSTIVTTPQGIIDDTNNNIDSIRESIVQFLENSFPCTELPSMTPSAQPSLAPTTTSRPSNIPSQFPSLAPTTTNQPSNIPSMTQMPSLHPSNSPTMVPIIGKVFLPDPLTSSGNTYGRNGYADNGDRDSDVLDSQTFEVRLENLLDVSSGNFILVGKYAQIVDAESPFKGLFAQSSENFLFSRFQDGFEAVNCYYHINEFMEYMDLELGITIESSVYEGGVKFDPHGFGGDDNSHYVNGLEYIAFGEGGVDDGEDADVIIHELGHLIHHWLTGYGRLNQVHGLSEGFGDYLANSYARSYGILTPDDDQYYWVFKWDGHNTFWDGRRTDSNKVYPTDISFRKYEDAVLWSSCNMRVHDAIGRVNSDRAHILGLSATDGLTISEDVANAIVTAARNLGYSDEVMSTMISVYSACGYSIYA